MVQPSNQPGLTAKALNPTGVGQEMRMKLLEGNGPLLLGIVGAVDHGKAAPANLLQDLITFCFLDHLAPHYPYLSLTAPNALSAARCASLNPTAPAMFIPW